MPLVSVGLAGRTMEIDEFPETLQGVKIVIAEKLELPHEHFVHVISDGKSVLLETQWTTSSKNTVAALIRNSLEADAVRCSVEFGHIQPDFMNNRCVVISAVGRFALAIRDTIDLRADREIGLLAVQGCANTLRYLNCFWSDYEVVFAAVSQIGEVLKYVNDDLKANKAIVLAAVSNNGLALVYASPELQDDEDIVRAAATQDERALQFASERQRVQSLS
jgi:hypothetical protein